MILIMPIASFRLSRVNKIKTDTQTSMIYVRPISHHYSVDINAALQEIKGFKVGFIGIKSELPTSEVSVRQSNNERKTFPHTPERLEVDPLVPRQLTCQRLHFMATTQNNNRKNGRTHPDQRYFNLLVRIYAETTDDKLVLIQAHASDKVIVRVC